jgi:GTP-binding protein
MSLSTDPQRIVSGNFLAAAAEATSLPPPALVEIAFLGRSNVGKSSLLNTICQRRSLFRTSSTPGCTRQLVFFSAKTKDAAELTLVDVPGYGYAQRSKGERQAWAALIDAYLGGRPTLRAAALLIDGRRDIQTEERELTQLLTTKTVARPPIQLVAVVTKLDKLSTQKRPPVLARVEKELGLETVGFSTRLAETHVAVWRALRRAASLGTTTT